MARFAMTADEPQLRGYLRKLARRHRDVTPVLHDGLVELLRSSPTRAAPLAEASAPLPVDADTRLQLLRIIPPGPLSVEPIYAADTAQALSQLVRERENREQLEQELLTPASSALLVGPPGVGKSLTAEWLAFQLGLPLMVLDLSAVMSSFLGRTGTNLRHVLEYAKSVDGILLLDEFDAIAKRRDDATEVGELKRLVTVLLQEIDGWPSTGILLAATNHPDLLDPAVWRRFDMVVRFPMPSNEQVQEAMRGFMGPLAEEHPEWVQVLARVMQGESYSAIEREALRLRRRIAVNRDLDEDPEELFSGLLMEHLDAMSHDGRIALAVELVQTGAASQRLSHRITGVSRDTIRRKLRP